MLGSPMTSFDAETELKLIIIYIIIIIILSVEGFHDTWAKNYGSAVLQLSYARVFK